MKHQVERKISEELHRVTKGDGAGAHREQTLEKILEESVPRKKVLVSADWKFLFQQLYLVEIRSAMVQLTLLLTGIITTAYVQRKDFSMVFTRHLPLILGVMAVVVGMAGMMQRSRSAKYHMAEVEAVARISRRKIQLFQSGILLLEHIILFGVMFWLLKKGGAVFTHDIIVYVLLPYLVVCIGSSFIQRYTDSKQADYVNAVFGIGLVSVLVGIDRTFPAAFAADYQMVWLVLTIACLAVACHQLILEMKQPTGDLNIPES